MGLGVRLGLVEQTIGHCHQRCDGARLDQEEAQGWVKQHLARYKVPREGVFLDELPRNATGKVLKRELTQRDDA